MHTKVAIIGSGPAGLTAGIYASRADLKPIIFAGEKFGGQLMLTSLVENYPGFKDGVLGPQLMMDMIKQAEKFGSTMVYKSVTKVVLNVKPFEIYINQEKYTSDSVIIATGSSSRWLGLPNEMSLIGRGVSTCATCDAAFFRNKKVAIIGGGDSAMEEALYLTKFATEVNLIHRRDEFRASKIMQKHVMDNPKIKIIFNSEVKKLIPTKEMDLNSKTPLPADYKLKGIEIFNSKTNETTSMDLDGVFVAIGYIPQTAIFKETIDTDENGYIKPTDGKAKTNVEGVFVCGDVEDHRYRQAIVAAGGGCMAAMEAETYLSGNLQEA